MRIRAAVAAGSRRALALDTRECAGPFQFHRPNAARTRADDRIRETPRLPCGPLSAITGGSCAVFAVTNPNIRLAIKDEENFRFPKRSAKSVDTLANAIRTKRAHHMGGLNVKIDKDCRLTQVRIRKAGLGALLGSLSLTAFSTAAAAQDAPATAPAAQDAGTQAASANGASRFAGRRGHRRVRPQAAGNGVPLARGGHRARAAAADAAVDLAADRPLARRAERDRPPIDRRLRRHPGRDPRPDHRGLQPVERRADRHLLRRTPMSRKQGTHRIGLRPRQRRGVLAACRGTLSGRNNTGGAIRFYTAKPVLGETSATLSGSYGTHDLHRESAVVNLPIGDTLAVRFGFQDSYRGPIGHSTVTARRSTRSTSSCSAGRSNGRRAISSRRRSSMSIPGEPGASGVQLAARRGDRGRGDIVHPRQHQRFGRMLSGLGGGAVQPAQHLDRGSDRQGSRAFGLRPRYARLQAQRRVRFQDDGGVSQPQRDHRGFSTSITPRRCRRSAPPSARPPSSSPSSRSSPRISSTAG